MKGPYSFASEPRPVQTGKNVGYRNNKAWGSNPVPDRPMNIMHDRRVVRGNTYSSQVITENARTEAERYRVLQEKEKRKRMALQERQNNNPAPRSPPPVPGRKHIDIQTEQYLEELSDRVIESEVETQTEAFMDRPTEPLFMPAYTGVDKETQVDVDELFDFDLEVEPILEVLVGKTLEHAMMEVLEEEELEAIRRHQAAFDQERNSRLAEVQRLEAEEKRRTEEKKRRMEQEQERVQRENQIKESVAARQFAKDYLVDLHTSVFNKLLDAGHFQDPVVKEIKADFLPWISDAVAVDVQNVKVARKLTSLLIQETLQRLYAKPEPPVEEEEPVPEEEGAEEEATGDEEDAEEAAATEDAEGAEEAAAEEAEPSDAIPNEDLQDVPAEADNVAEAAPAPAEDGDAAQPSDDQTDE